MNASTAIKKFGLEQAFNYLYKDPKENLVKLMDWADKFAGGEFETQRKLIREAITDPKHPYYPFIQRLLTGGHEDHRRELLYQRLLGWMAQAGGVPQEIWLQYSMGHSSGPHQCLQPPLHRLLGR